MSRPSEAPGDTPEAPSARNSEPRDARKPRIEAEPAAGDAIAHALAELDERPAREWEATLLTRFPDDPALVRQLLLWQRVHRDAADERGRGSLGASTRYELGVRLDRGATASVWRAYDRRLRREVAIKVFDAGSSFAVDEILAEARAACEVISEHVVRVLDVPDAEPPYIVMELVGEHQTRDGALQPGAWAATCRPRDLAEAVRWVRDVARGVHDAHLRDVFHRDLKPHNVLITPISRRAKVADFGLAVRVDPTATHPTATRPTARAAAPRSSVRVAGAAVRIAGTPGYMAPEQAAGLPVALDPRDPADRTMLVGIDVWGLGAIAYDLLSGRAPWQAADGVAAWEVAASGGRPPPLDRASGGEHIPARLRRIVERALASAPADRYASAGELADELQAVLARRPTSFDRSPVMRAALWAKRNPQLTVTATVAVLLAGMSLAAYHAVLHLRDQRSALAAEIRAVEADHQRLADQAARERRELDTTEANLHAQAASLHALRQSLADAEREYRAIVQAREQASRALAAERDDRDVADRTRELYEGFWMRARKDADEAARERDQALRELEAARAQAQQVTQERDEARTSRATAEHDRDAARAERDRNIAARRQGDAEIARLMSELSMTLRAGGSAAHAPDAPDVTDPAKGAAH